MKIGILTFHRPCNFGANLQALASSLYLKSLNHDVKVIDYVRQIDLNYKSFVSETQYSAHNRFVERELNLTKQAIDEISLREIVKDENFDAILIGADAVWRTPSDNCIFFAKWLFSDLELQNKMSVASLSAAHMGPGFSFLTDKVKKDIFNCLSHFKYISVRDSWTKEVLNRDILKTVKMNIRVNPDPVFMLSDYVDGVEWQNHEIGTEKKYYVMTLPVNWSSDWQFGLLRKMWFARFKNIVNKKGYKLIELPLPEGKSGMDFDYVVDYPIDSLQWFLWINNAKAFCGIRFHAIVSALSCVVPFFSLDSYGSGKKRAKLYRMLGFYSASRKYDKMSKIANLLKGTSMESYRIAENLEFISPSTLFNKLESCPIAKVKEIRDKNKKVFADNINEMLSVL